MLSVIAWPVQCWSCPVTQRSFLSPVGIANATDQAYPVSRLASLSLWEQVKNVVCMIYYDDMHLSLDGAILCLYEKSFSAQRGKHISAGQIAQQAKFSAIGSHCLTDSLGGLRDAGFAFRDGVCCCSQVVVCAFHRLYHSLLSLPLSPDEDIFAEAYQDVIVDAELAGFDCLFT